jgi:glycosyltransferase involved in cell wall biosynthesis
MRKIRILQIIPSCQRGGVPSVIYELIRNIDKKRFKIHLVAPNDGLLNDAFTRLCPVYDIPIRGCYPLSVCRLRRLINTAEIDIVHTHGKGAGLYGRLASIGSRAKTVYTLHGFHNDHYKPPFRYAYTTVEKLLAHFTGQVITVSEGERHKAHMAGILPPGRSIVIHNGIALKHAPHGKVEGHILGTLSRSCIAKGLEFLIGAIALLKDKYPDLICYIAGGTPKGAEAYETVIRNMVRQLGLEDRIVFLDEISDIESFFAKISIYVSTSRWEGLPTAVLEAFVSKVPVVATDVVGNSDLVKHLETGILTKTEDSKSVAAGIDYAFQNPDLMNAFAANAFHMVSENYSIEKMVKRHEALYESLMAQ